jgi:glutaminyl-tRNA synthetase
VSAPHALNFEARLYDHLFSVENPMSPLAGKTWLDLLNPNSLDVRTNCWVEPSVADANAGSRFQFERLGYFCVDPDSTSERLVFNRTVSLRDSWRKAQQQSE